jgi:hypothetical protein
MRRAGALRRGPSALSNQGLHQGAACGRAPCRKQRDADRGSFPPTFNARLLRPVVHLYGGRAVHPLEMPVAEGIAAGGGEMAGDGMPLAPCLGDRA